MITQQPKDYRKDKAIFPALVAPKLDGVRGRTIKGVIRSRRNKPIYGMTHIEKQLAILQCEFDGELTVDGKDFDSASGLIRNHNEAPNTVFNVFDVPDSKQDKTTRLSYLTNLFESGVGSDTVKLVPHYWVNSEI